MSNTVNDTVSVTRLLQDMPATVPFVGPEALERRSGHTIDVRIGANESAFGISPRAREAMRAAVEQVHWYGDPENYELRAALARHHGIALENVGVASGIDDLLGLLVRAFLDRGDVAVTSRGAYPTFNYHVAGYGAALQYVPYRDDRNDLQALAETAHRAGARMVYLANPDNPSGTWHTAGDLRAFVEQLPPSCLLILDEAYAEFAPDDACLPMAEIDPRVVRLRTFSKAHGMAGARVGYAVALAPIIAAFDKIRLHFGVNRVAQAGALASLDDAAFVRSVVAAVAEGRREYVALAQELGLATLPSATNFVTIDVGGPERARALVESLLQRGIFIRMPGAPPLDRCIRVTVGTPAQRAAFAATFRELWENR